MQNLGHSRSSHCLDHLLVTPDTFVRAPRPEMQNATAVVHAAPALGAGFTWYTAEFQPGGSLGPADGQRFVYVLEGEVRHENKVLGPGEFAYFPEGWAVLVESREGGRAAVIEKPYLAIPSAKLPSTFNGDEHAVEPRPLGDDPDLQVRVLIPENPSFDFAVNTMTFQPGAALPMVEIHVMEHGLLMLEGGGIYRLGDRWYPVTAGDFIWMAPYCPQWFGALGKKPAKYLIYKDWNR